MSGFNISQLLDKKRDGKEWTREELKFLLDSLEKKEMQDFQIGAMLMAIAIRGIPPSETVYLTQRMIDSGHKFSWPDSFTVVDKHSTGGVGDKISLPLAPALADCGLKVPMISGRGLGHTGGTLDKLESIPGFNVTLSEDEIVKAVEKVGCCIVGQTDSLVPIDKTLYRIRDVTGTVPSIPLVVGSIVSKKAAEGLKTLVLDIKCGNGAISTDSKFMEDLARDMVEVSNGLGINTTGVLTKHDHPIGNMIGNALEVAEAIQCMQGKAPDSLTKLVTILGGHALFNSGKAKTAEDGAKAIEESLCNGSALKKFCEMMKHQGVKSEIAEKLCSKDVDVFTVLPAAASKTEFKANRSGYITNIAARPVANFNLSLGAGRTKAGEKIDHAVGIQIHKHVGSKVEKEDIILTIHHNKALPSSFEQTMLEAVTISNEAPAAEEAVLKIFHK